MIIKVTDADALEKRHAYWGFDESSPQHYKVLAVRRSRGKYQYLVDYDRRLHWWDADLFEITDESVPREWTEAKYKRFHAFKNRKYNFRVPVTYYRGPKEFLANAAFFFDIHENPRTAHEFYKTI